MIERLTWGIPFVVLLSSGSAVLAQCEVEPGELDCWSVCDAALAERGLSQAERCLFRVSLVIDPDGVSLQPTCICESLAVIPGRETPPYLLCGEKFSRRLQYNDENRNRGPARVLSRLDIDRNGVADNAPDSDGDGLPDNWEVGGQEGEVDDDSLCEQSDRIVRIPAPSPLIPGTPPTPIFTRLAVATDALDYDTDHDGLSDFVEVFGLMFIDDNRDGRLDVSEWKDDNDDGLPSPGEYPVPLMESFSGLQDIPEAVPRHDFDGFIFTDPTNPDTDGDGIADGLDRDPLINPRAFGRGERGFEVATRFNPEGDADLDNDGLGNGMDMGNDLTEDDGIAQTKQTIDNPLNLTDLIALFREDLLKENVMPESLIEDLLGLDWNGDGLWRTTDIRDWSLVTPMTDNGLNAENNDPSTEKLFCIDHASANGEKHCLYAGRDFDDLPDGKPAEEVNKIVPYGGGGIGLGFQRLLEPGAPTDFLPDRRIFGILYAWRVPGFDIDGDGFVGAPTIAATGEFVCTVDDRGVIDVNTEENNIVTTKCKHVMTRTGELMGVSIEKLQESRQESEFDSFDDRIEVAARQPADGYDGVIQPLPMCGRNSFGGPGLIVFGLMGLALLPRRSRGKVAMLRHRTHSKDELGIT